MIEIDIFRSATAGPGGDNGNLQSRTAVVFTSEHLTPLEESVRIRST